MINILEGMVPFGVLQIHPDVIISEGLVPAHTAHHAARTVRRLYRDAKKLPYVFEDNDRSDTLSIGWSRMSLREFPSVFDYPEDLAGMRSLKLCVDRLLQFAEVEEPILVHLLADSKGLRDYHTDEFSLTRSLLLLEGVKEVSFAHPYASVRTVYTQTPGDAYQMEFRPDESSVMHAVNNTLEHNVSLYVDAFSD